MKKMFVLLVMLVVLGCSNIVLAQGTLAYTDSLVQSSTADSNTVTFLWKRTNFPLGGKVTYSGTVTTVGGTDRVVTFYWEMQNKQGDYLTSHTLGTATSSSGGTIFEFSLGKESWWGNSKGGEFKYSGASIGSSDTLAVYNVVDWD